MDKGYEKTIPRSTQMAQSMEKLAATLRKGARAKHKNNQIRKSRSSLGRAEFTDQ